MNSWGEVLFSLVEVMSIARVAPVFTKKPVLQRVVLSFGEVLDVLERCG